MARLKTYNCNYAALAFFPLLQVVRISKISENATDYSLYNTVRNVLFLPTTREQKYKGKQVTDTIFVRSGDVLSAGLVYVGLNWFLFDVQDFARLNVFLATIWIGVAFWVGRENKKMVERQEVENVS